MSTALTEDVRLLRSGLASEQTEIEVTLRLPRESAKKVLALLNADRIGFRKVGKHHHIPAPRSKRSETASAKRGTPPSPRSLSFQIESVSSIEPVGRARGHGLALPSPSRTSPKLDADPERELTDEAPAFTLFAELFAKAQPKTDPDKALVAAYWLQMMQGQDKWQSAELQKELKNLGHAIGI